jgi:hypothetical protein
MMKSHSHRPEKPFPCLLAPQLGRGSRRSDDGFTTQAVSIFTPQLAQRSQQRTAPRLHQQPHRSTDPRG